MSEPKKLELKDVQTAVSGTAAAFRCITEYQPAGGPGDKVFPPTYEGGKYATERRRLPGYAEPVECVLLDSAQSQANRMELALLEAWRADDIKLPVIAVEFADEKLKKSVGTITSLEAPHRLADAILRDAMLPDGSLFSESKHAEKWQKAKPQNATPIFEICPTALVFGMWGSPKKPGGLGAKFTRALVSEIVGIAHVSADSRPGYRIDPLEVRSAVRVAKDDDGKWHVADNPKAKDTLKPSEINHGNIPYTSANGGVTITKAIQTTVLSLPALRRLQFPVDGKNAPNDEARTALAALALCAATLSRLDGFLRSRCHLVAQSRFEWQLLDQPGDEPKTYSLSVEDAVSMFKAAVSEATKAGLPWLEKGIKMSASKELLKLVSLSQEYAETQEEDEKEAN